jgi:peptidoglycan/xylan/chitin deacetylase (PgdA/CDA1 family)
MQGVVHTFRILILLLLLADCGDLPEAGSVFDHGGLVRSDTSRRQIHLVFTGHEFADGYDIIKQALDVHQVKAHFFFTGDFYRIPQHEPIIRQLLQGGHYLGAHSDKHLLYCSWENRDSLLIGKKEFITDLHNNYLELQRFGIQKSDAPVFMPPYEWYNDSISRWTSEMGLTLINYAPGTLSHTDWTYPELGTGYRSSDVIYKSIVDFEKKQGMNGFILLLHIGTDPRRKDKFYGKLDPLIRYLISRGYKFTLLTDI